MGSPIGVLCGAARYGLAGWPGVCGAVLGDARWLPVDRAGTCLAFEFRRGFEVDWRDGWMETGGARVRAGFDGEAGESRFRIWGDSRDACSAARLAKW